MDIEETKDVKEGKQSKIKIWKESRWIDSKGTWETESHMHDHIWERQDSVKRYGWSLAIPVHCTNSQFLIRSQYSNQSHCIFTFIPYLILNIYVSIYTWKANFLACRWTPWWGLGTFWIVLLFIHLLQLANPFITQPNYAINHNSIPSLLPFSKIKTLNSHLLE